MSGTIVWTFVSIMVPDTFFLSEHEDLRDNVLPGGVEPAFGDEHGTLIARIIAAKTDNQIGVAGIAGDASIMSLDVGETIDVRAASFIYAADNGAQIVSCSIPLIPEPSQPGFDTYLNAVDHMSEHSQIF